VKSGLSGSTPRREAKYSASASLPRSAALVHEQHLLAVVEVHPHARVLGLLVAQQDVARHPKVHDEVDVVLERHHQVLAAAP
jgi:hypothetical protein